MKSMKHYNEIKAAVEQDSTNKSSIGEPVKIDSRVRHQYWGYHVYEVQSYLESNGWVKFIFDKNGQLTNIINPGSNWRIGWKSNRERLNYAIEQLNRSRGKSLK